MKLAMNVCSSKSLSTHHSKSYHPTECDITYAAQTALLNNVQTKCATSDIQFSSIELCLGYVF